MSKRYSCSSLPRKLSRSTLSYKLMIFLVCRFHALKIALRTQVFFSIDLKRTDEKIISPMTNLFTYFCRSSHFQLKQYKRIISLIVCTILSAIIFNIKLNSKSLIIFIFAILKEMDIDDLQFEVLPQLTPEEQKKIQQEHIERLQKFYSKTHVYSMQNWYKNLSQYTFHSLPFPLTNIQGFVISTIYQNNQQILKRQNVQKAYENLVKKIDNFLAQNFPNGCFMKLSTRSPKDAGWRFKQEQEIQRHSVELTNRLKDSTSLDKKTVNKIYLYFLQQSKKKIKITSGKDFIQIFTNSQRIQIDINDLATLNGNAFKRLHQQDYSTAEQTLIDVWGRQWVDCQWKDQFRCFFYNNQLTAISQYDQRCFFSQIQEQKDIIIKKAIQFFQIIKPKLSQINMSEGVMDLIIDINNDYVKMVQINIYDHNSRASLFDWNKDQEILKKGPLSLRILQEEIYISRYELLKMMGMVEKGIQNILQQVFQRLKLQKQWEQLL